MSQGMWAAADADNIPLSLQGTEFQSYNHLELNSPNNLNDPRSGFSLQTKVKPSQHLTLT